MAKKRYLVACAVCAALLMTISQFPLRLAMSAVLPDGQSIFYANHMAGTVWAGRAQGVVFAGQRFGEMSVRTSLAAMVTRARATKITWRSARQSGAAFVAMGGDAITLADIDSRIVLGQPGLAGVGQLSGGQIVYSEQGCRSASGELTVTLQNPKGSYPGSLSCVQGTLILSIALNGVTQTIPLMENAR